MLKKLLLATLIFWVSNTFASAQQKSITVTGTVLDKDTNQPLEYATLVLQSTTNPDQVTGGITNAKGKFRVAVSPGTYNIRVEFISYQTYELKNQTLQDNTDLGTIRLGINANELDALVIVAEKTTVDVRLDKKIYNIGKDLTTSGGNVSDALGNIPSVTVDVDGAIALRGNGNVRILINGKPSALAGFGSTDALRQLPADAIERVEVITSPSARYDAEGTAGILNIILRKEKILGFNGSVTTSIGFPIGGQLGTNLNLRTNSFNVFGTFGYRYSEPPGNAFFDNRYTRGEFDRIIEDRSILRQNKNLNSNIGLEYYLTKKSSLTGSFFTRFSNGIDRTENSSQRFIDAIISERTFRVEDEEEDDFSYQFSLNYQNNFNDKGHKLTADFQYSRSDEDITTTIDEFQNPDFPIPAFLASEKIEEGELQNEYLVQADYVLPIGDRQIEAGYRGTFEEEITSFRLDTLSRTSGLFELNETLTNVFSYTENVNAIYTQYGDKIGEKFSFLLGLRFENTQLKGKVTSDFDTSEIEQLLGADIDLNFDKNYPGLFPTVNLIYEFREEENISLGYNRRINRPRGYFINPFPSRSSRTNIFQGNPDLDPSYSNAFDLGYLKRWEKITLTSSIYYQQETNAFERVQEETGQITSDGIRVIRTIPINLSTEKRYGTEAGLLYNPNKWLRLNASFNLFGFDIEGVFNEVDFGTQNVSWFTRFSGKVSLPGKIDWQTNAFYRGPRENAQTKSEGILSIDLAFSKDIMDEKGTITFRASDILNSRKRRSFTSTPFFTSDNEFQWRERQFNITFVYRINQKKERNGKRNDSGDDGDGEY